MCAFEVESSYVEGSQVVAQADVGQAPPTPPAASTEVASVPPRITRQARRRQQRVAKKQEKKGRSQRAASYSRFSSDLQRDESNESQQRKCRELAEQNSHEIHPDLEFSDSATSGTKLHRFGLDALLKASEAGEFSTLYVFSLSRLARQSIITLPILKRLVHTDRVRVISVSEGIDSDRTGWELIAAIYSIIHEQFITDLSAHTLRGQEEAVLDGFSVGDWCFGYGSQDLPEGEASGRGKNSKPRKVYVIQQDHAEWVIKIFHWFVEEGRSIRWIVRELNRCKAPKDHRSRMPEWEHQLVVGVLSNTKYVGIWPWGEKFNVRDPMTGKIRQDFRPEEACQAWTRELPHLRIVSDEIFQRAQSKLEANFAKWKLHRNEKGKFNGSSESCNGRTLKRLLHGLLICDACGQPFRYLGIKLKCRGHHRCVCTVKTELQAEAAERKVLDVIRDRLENDEEWFQLVYQNALASYRDYSSRVPSELASKENELRQLELRIANLIDSLEAGDRDVSERLHLRQVERDALICKIEELRSGSRQHAQEPTEAWVREQLAHMRELLSESSPAANEALRNLLDGGIRLVESQRPRRKSKILTGQLRLNVRCITPHPDPNGIHSTQESSCEVITIDFHELDKAEEQRNLAKQLLDQGLLKTQIASRLGVSRSRVTAIFKEWCEIHGQALPDGRTRRSTLQVKHVEPPLYQAIADQVMHHFEQGLLLDEIAQQLKVDCNTITASVKFWHTSRNLPVPDGRTRRKSLARKTRQA